MRTRLSILVLIAVQAFAALVSDVRQLATKGEFTEAEKMVAEARKQSGLTPEVVEAHSWLGRGALGQGKFDQAQKYAAETRTLVASMLKTRKLDDEDRLPIALGASIEVHGQSLAKKGDRDEAVAYFRQQLMRYRTTSMRQRIQKNINLLTLQGQVAPPIQSTEWIFPKAPSLASLKGKPLLLFFWAHWCGDCKRQMPILVKLRDEFKSSGLTLIGPTQRYGYAERGREVGPAEELKYIEQVRNSFYEPLAGMPVPVSGQVFDRYGVSTTPTIVLVNAKGIVTMYHPGALTYEELKAEILEAINSRT